MYIGKNRVLFISPRTAGCRSSALAHCKAGGSSGGLVKTDFFYKNIIIKQEHKVNPALFFGLCGKTTICSQYGQRYYFITNPQFLCRMILHYVLLRYRSVTGTSSSVGTLPVVP